MESQMFFKKWLCVLFLVMAAWSIDASALQVSRPSAEDPRLRIITYREGGIHQYIGFYDYQASIVLGSGEEVKTISMGNPASWQIIPNGNRIFIKPIATNPDEAKTNMLLITNKRHYHFILEAAETDVELGMDDPNLVWETRFVYPDETSDAVQRLSRTDKPDLSQPEKYNFSYTISGANTIAPLRIFDDGEFTYFEFSPYNTEVPAFFLVDSAGREALVNYRMVDDYVVIERVASQFTLRHGPDVVCVFNDKIPLPKLAKKKK